MAIKKVLTFRASAIGDALNAKYLLENIHAVYPDARCGIVVAGRAGMIRDLLAAYPWIDIIEANRKDIGSLWRLWKSFRGSDIVVTPPAKPTGRFALPSKIAARVLARRGGLYGFADLSKWNHLIYDHVLTPDPLRAPRLLEQDVLAAAHVPVRVTDMRLSYIPQPHLAERLGLQGKKYLVLHLFAGSESRAMSAEKRQSLVDALAQTLPDTPIVFTGTKTERVYIERLTLPPTSLVAAGDLTVQELAALIAGSTCMVSIGTGPSHMASNLGAPVIVLVVCVGIPWCGTEEFGDGAAEIFSDTDACVLGHDYSKSIPLCIEGIDVNAVARAAAQHFLPTNPN
jgi:ADP-heptose:LPS heptosyltransferase